MRNWNNWKWWFCIYWSDMFFKKKGTFCFIFTFYDFFIMFNWCSEELFFSAASTVWSWPAKNFKIWLKSRSAFLTIARSSVIEFWASLRGRLPFFFTGWGRKFSNELLRELPQVPNRIDSKQLEFCMFFFGFLLDWAQAIAVVSSAVASNTLFSQTNFPMPLLVVSSMFLWGQSNLKNSRSAGDSHNYQAAQRVQDRPSRSSRDPDLQNCQWLIK